MGTHSKTAVLFLISLMLLSLVGCTGRIPDTSSDGLGLYIRRDGGKAYDVDEDGRANSAYSVDKKGNITDTRRTVIIGAANAELFVPVENISADDTGVFDVILDTVARQQEIEVIGDSSMGTMASVMNVFPIERTVRVSLTVSPDNVTCRSFTVSSGTEGISLSPLNDDTADPASGDLSCTLSGNAIIFDFTCKDECSGMITVRSGDGECEKAFFVNAVKSDRPLNEEEMADFEETTYTDFTEDYYSGTAVSSSVSAAVLTNEFETTENTPGWIKGSKVNLREKASTSSNVLGAYTSGKAITVLGSRDGWTKVQIDGITGYVKTVYVTQTDPSGTASSSGTSATYTSSGPQTYYSGSSGGTGSNTVVNAPPTSNDGGNHGNATSAIAGFAGDDGHSHVYEIYQIVEPTPEKQGYTIYRCGCGASYTGDYTDRNSGTGAHIHSYEDSTVAATCEECGYTLHTCKCGDTYRDCFTEPEGHRFRFFESGGAVYEVCDECGYTYSDDSE